MAVHIFGGTQGFPPSTAVYNTEFGFHARRTKIHEHLHRTTTVSEPTVCLGTLVHFPFDIGRGGFETQDHIWGPVRHMAIQERHGALTISGPWPNVGPNRRSHRSFTVCFRGCGSGRELQQREGPTEREREREKTPCPAPTAKNASLNS